MYRFERFVRRLPAHNDFQQITEFLFDFIDDTATISSDLLSTSRGAPFRKPLFWRNVFSLFIFTGFHNWIFRLKLSHSFRNQTEPVREKLTGFFYVV